MVRDDVISPNKEVVELTRSAQDAWQALSRNESPEFWHQVGAAIDAYRRQLFLELKINTTHNHAYKLAMGKYLQANGWADPKRQKGARGIADSTRTNLQHLIDHWPEVEKWRQELQREDYDRWLRFNHPNTLWGAFLDTPHGQQYRRQQKPPKKETATQPNDTIRVGIRDNDEKDYIVYEKQDAVENYKDSFEVTSDKPCVVRPEPASNFDFRLCTLQRRRMEGWRHTTKTGQKLFAKNNEPQTCSASQGRE